MLRWHRDIVRRRWPDKSIRGKTSRPATRKNIKTLVLRLARENPGWGVPQDPRGTCRPGSEDSRLNGGGDSQEGRNPPCATPIRAYLVAVPAIQAEAILACDFFTADLLDGTQAYVLAVIEHATRRSAGAAQRILARHFPGGWAPGSASASARCSTVSAVAWRNAPLAS